MKKIFPLLFSFAAGAVFWNCSSADDEVSTANNRWTLSTIATKDSGEVMTRALFIGGASGKRYVSLWDETDVVQVYREGTASQIGSMKPANFDVPTTELIGTFTGSVSVGETLDMYIPSADIDYTRQTGSLEDMTKYAFMAAQVQVNRIEGGNVYTDNVTFTGKEAYVRFRFLDKADGMRLPVEKFTLHAASGKLLLRKPLTPTSEDPIVHGDLVVNTVKKNGAYPNEIYVAIHNDLGAKDEYTFTVVSGGYVYSLTASTTFTDTNYKLLAVNVTLQGTASRIATNSEVTNFQNGNGATGETGSVTF